MYRKPNGAGGYGTDNSYSLERNQFVYMSRMRKAKGNILRIEEIKSPLRATF